MIEAGPIEAGPWGETQPRERRFPKSAAPQPDRIDVLGCQLDALDLNGTVKRCLELLESGDGARQVSMNAAKLTQVVRDREMASFVRGSDVVSADGQAVVWASRMLGDPLPGRVPGIDLMSELLIRAEERGYGVYILGAREEVLERAVARIRSLHPRLRIVGSHHGYFAEDEEERLAREIRAAAPDLLFVAMSSPRKEHWLARNAAALNVPFAMGVGGAIDILAGERRRAPDWLQSLGLEWLYRFLQEPRRMWRRYLLGNLTFIWLVIRARGRRAREAWQGG